VTDRSRTRHAARQRGDNQGYVPGNYRPAAPTSEPDPLAGPPLPSFNGPAGPAVPPPPAAMAGPNPALSAAGPDAPPAIPPFDAAAPPPPPPFGAAPPQPAAAGPAMPSPSAAFDGPPVPAPPAFPAPQPAADGPVMPAPAAFDGPPVPPPPAFDAVPAADGPVMPAPAAFDGPPLPPPPAFDGPAMTGPGAFDGPLAPPAPSAAPPAFNAAPGTAAPAVDEVFAPPPPPPPAALMGAAMPSIPAPEQFAPADPALDALPALPPLNAPGFGGAPAVSVPQLVLPDSPAPPAGDEPQQAADDGPAPPPFMYVQEGQLALPMVHSICSLTMKPNYDEMMPALAHFKTLQKGEYAFIRFSVRPARPSVRKDMEAMYNQVMAGEQLRPATKKQQLKGLLSYGMALIYFAFNQGKRGVEPPRAPWKRQRMEKARKEDLTLEQRHAQKFAEEKVNAGGFYETKVRIGAIGPESRRDVLKDLTNRVVEDFSTSYSNAGTSQGFEWQETSPYDTAIGMMPVERTDQCVLSSPELGEMAKVPDGLSTSSSVDIQRGKMIVEPKEQIVVPDPLCPPEGVIPIGEIAMDTARHRSIGMPIAGLATHAYVCGTTGSGKSTLLEWLLYGLAKNEVWWPGKFNRGAIFVVDPHGELCDAVASNILAFAPERAKDIIIMDFGNTEWPIAFNPLSITSQAEIEGTVNAVKDMILKMLNLNPDSAPRAVNYTEQAVWALCEANLRGLSSHPNLHLSLLQVPEFFTNKDFRQLVMQFCTNIAIKAAFGPEGPFERLGERMQLDHVMPILRTFDSLSTKDSFGNVFGQSESKIDFAHWVRQRKIVLMKLPAITGGDAAVAKFIGAMVTPMMIGSLAKWAHDPDLAAFLVIDEFQNYATESFKDLLAQTRKYGLWAIAVNQVPQDLPADVLRGVQSNTQTKFAGRLDAQAVRMISDFIASGESYPRPDDIVKMDSYWFWANVKMNGGKNSGPFSMKGLAPPLDRNNPLFGDRYDEGKSNLDRLLPEVVNQSRLTLSVPRDQAWQARQTHVPQAMAVMERRMQEAASKGLYDNTGMSISEEAAQTANWDFNA